MTRHVERSSLLHLVRFTSCIEKCFTNWSFGVQIKAKAAQKFSNMINLTFICRKVAKHGFSSAQTAVLKLKSFLFKCFKNIWMKTVQKSAFHALNASK